MNLFWITLAYLRSKWLSRLLVVILLGSGVGAVLGLMQVSQQIQDRFRRDAAGVDLVLGAKGSPLQLVLSSLYHLDIPTGNISAKEAARWVQHKQVKQAVPLALGDSYRQHRIIGTTPAFAELYRATLAEGRMMAAPMEAIVGSAVSLAVGAQFAGSHGLTPGGEVHAEFPYSVVGRLKPTGTALDNLILTPVESVWKIHTEHEHEHDHEHEHKHEAHSHAHEKEASPEAGEDITAYLITFKTPAAALSLPRQINRLSNLQAASPAFEISKLLRLIGLSADSLKLAGGLLCATALIALLSGLAQALHDRQGDLALMRVMGASPKQLFRLLIQEASLLLLSGIALGILLSRLFLSLLSGLQPVINTTWTFACSELWFVGLFALAALLIAALLTARSYRASIGSVLSYY